MSAQMQQWQLTFFFLSFLIVSLPSNFLCVPLFHPHCETGPLLFVFCSHFFPSLFTILTFSTWHPKRPDLHEFLRSKISPERLTTGKRVIDIIETQSEVTVTCMDETTYVGHLVIGADGAYSAVRQIMYKKLQEKGLLPEVDKKPLHFDKQCVVGKSRNGILPSFVVFVVLFILL